MVVACPSKKRCELGRVCGHTSSQGQSIMWVGAKRQVWIRKGQGKQNNIICWFRPNSQVLIKGATCDGICEDGSGVAVQCYHN